MFGFGSCFTKILILSVLLLSELFAQSKFYNLTAKDGLPGNNSLCYFKDARGLIWFGTEKGLCRYDGVRFKRFVGNPERESELPNSSIHTIIQLSDDALLLLQSSGTVIRYRYSTGRFEDLQTQFSYMKERALRGVYQQKNGSIWFATDIGLIHANANLQMKAEYVIGDSVQGHPSANMVNNIVEDKNGMFWLGMFYRGVLRFNPRTGQFLPGLPGYKIPHVQVKSLVTQPGSPYVFVGLLGQGLFRIDVDKLTGTNTLASSPGKVQLPSTQINSMQFENDSILWIGTQEGLVRLNIVRNKIEVFQHDPDKYFSLVNNNISQIGIDEQKILWILTYGGVSSTHLGKTRFSKVAHVPSDVRSPISDGVNGVQMDRNGNLWLGTAKGISVAKDVYSGYFHYPMPEVKGQAYNTEILQIFPDGDRMIISTWGGGIKICDVPKDFKAGQPLRFKGAFLDTMNSNSLGSNFTTKITKDKSGDFWISSWNGGISVLKKKNLESGVLEFSRIKAAKKPEEGLASNYTADLSFDAFDNLWVVTGAGLQKLDFSRKKFTLISSKVSSLPLLINMPVCLIPSSHGGFWYGTFGGLVHITVLDHERYTIKILYQDNERGVYSMVEDAAGKLWFSTNNSEIGSCDFSTGKVKFYSMSSEIDETDFYFGTPFRAKDGRIYFNSHSGLIHFHPTNIKDNATSLQPVITGISINGKEYQGGVDVTEVSELILDYDQRNLTIDFSNRNYRNPENNQYRYITEGLDKDWIDLKNNSHLSFVNLPAGEFVLKIIAANNDGVWNWEGKRLKLIVKPPLWANNYIRAVVIVLLITLTVYLVRKKIDALKAEREHQQLFSKMLIASQETERRRLSKELHDSLGQNLLIIKNWLQLYRSSSDKSENDLTQIEELVQDAVREVKDISSHLHPHQLERLGLQKAILALIKKISEATEILIDTDIQELPNDLPPEVQINIYRIIQEALNNIIKHAQARLVSISCNSAGGELNITINDDGVGFDTTDKEMQQAFTDGLGLKSIMERARFLGGNCKITSKPDSGTQITISGIPYEKSN